MIANNTGTHLGTAPHLVQIFQQPQTRPNPLDEVQPADLAHMIRQPRHRLGRSFESVEELAGFVVVVARTVHTVPIAQVMKLALRGNVGWVG